MAGATFVPVHNELVSVMFEKEDFPATRSECSLIYIPRLSPIVRGVIDRPSFSFATYMTSQPGGPTEVHQWIAQIFTAFRDLELRLLMGRLTSSAYAEDDARTEPPLHKRVSEPRDSLNAGRSAPGSAFARTTACRN
jgi:hypothetical protein